MIFFSYPDLLRKCFFIKRYKRFFVDVKLDNGEIDAVHCPNSGSMKSCLIEGATAYTLDSKSETRKLKHTLELMELDDGLACLNTGRANDFIFQVLKNYIEIEKKNIFEIENFKNYDAVQKEVKFNDGTRFDFCLTSKMVSKKCWIEVKSVSLKLENGDYAFPDAVTERGQKHLIELMHAKEQGQDAVLIFVLMRGTNIHANKLSQMFRACHEIDPKYAQLLKKAKETGVLVGLFIPEISIRGMALRKIEWLR